MKAATLPSLRVDPALREAADVVEGLAEQLESGQRSLRGPQSSRRPWLDSPRMQAQAVSRSLETPRIAVPTSENPVGFLCLCCLRARPARCLRREGGEYNTRKGNKPAGYARFRASRLPVRRTRWAGHFREGGGSDVEASTQ